MTPRPDPPDEKRARILEAAYAECERAGVDGARMEDVAARARVSKGTLYRYFESKGHLLLATILDSYEQFLPLFDSGSAAQAGPRERLESLLDGMVKVLEEVAPRMTVHYQAWGLVAGDPELKARLYGFLRDFHEARGRELEEVVRDGQEQGVFPADVDVDAVCGGIQALLSGFLYRATFHAEQATAGQLRGSFDALVVGRLLAAPDGGRRNG